MNIVSLFYQGGLCDCSAQVPCIAPGVYRMYCTCSAASSAQARVAAHATRHVHSVVMQLMSHDDWRLHRG